MDGVVVKTPRGADVRDEDDTNGVATVDAVITAFVNQKQPIAAEAHVHRQTMFLRDALRGTTHTHERERRSEDNEDERRSAA